MKAVKAVCVAFRDLILGVLQVLWYKSSPRQPRFQHQILAYHPDGTIEVRLHQMIDDVDALELACEVLSRTWDTRMVMRRRDKDEWRVIIDTDEINNWCATKHTPPHTGGT